MNLFKIYLKQSRVLLSSILHSGLVPQALGAILLSLRTRLFWYRAKASFSLLPSAAVKLCRDFRDHGPCLRRCEPVQSQGSNLGLGTATLCSVVQTGSQHTAGFPLLIRLVACPGLTWM